MTVDDYTASIIAASATPAASPAATPVGTPAAEAPQPTAAGGLKALGTGGIGGIG